MKSDDVVQLLRERRYEAPEWFTLEQVTPGKQAGRYIDLVAWNVWTSRDFPIHGIEIKVARSDWLRELKDPAKAEKSFNFVEAYFVAAPKGVVELAEVPPAWGYYEIDAGKVYDRKAATRTKRDVFSVSDVAAILQRVMTDWRSPRDVREIKVLREQYDAARDEVKDAGRNDRAKLKDIEDQLKQVERALGASSWEGAERILARARKLKKLMDLVEDEHTKGAFIHLLERASEPARRFLEDVEQTKKLLSGA